MMRTLMLLPLVVVFGLLLAALLIEGLASHAGNALERAYDWLHAAGRRRRATEPFHPYQP